FVLDPADERATALRLGGLTLPELDAFLDRGERGFQQKKGDSAAAALARGDEALGRSRWTDAAAAYREAHAVDSLARTLLAATAARGCAALAATEAPTMRRATAFASLVRHGLMAAVQGGTSAWAESAWRVLAPLAVEATALPATLRDDRFEIYQAL